MSNKVYDILKWCAMFLFPALAILIKTTFAIWNVPLGEEISGTIVAVNAFLGAVLGISNATYKESEDNE